MHRNHLNTAISAAQSSGEILTHYFSKLHDAKMKSSSARDLVTEVDLLSEKNIQSVIRQQFPDHSILGEEMGEISTASDYRWIIDPIDGTVNYVHGISMCAVSIALEYKREIVLGVVYNPFTKELYYALSREGAYLNGDRISSSCCRFLSEALVVTSYSSSGNMECHIRQSTISAQLNIASQGVLRIGTAALALSYLASGRIDLFWGNNIKIWDYAAGYIIAKEAGCVFVKQGRQTVEQSELLIGSATAELYQSALNAISAMEVV